MHILANQHYLRKKGKNGRPAWLERLDKSPAHWSSPAQRYNDQLMRLFDELTVALKRAPEPSRTAIAALHAIVLQLMRMVSEGVIRGMVRDEFWGKHCYEMVPINVEMAVKITNRLVEELGDRELRVLTNDATAPKVAKSEAA